MIFRQAWIPVYGGLTYTRMYSVPGSPCSAKVSGKSKTNPVPAVRSEANPKYTVVSSQQFVMSLMVQ
jgi:hypothetical protein